MYVCVSSVRSVGAVCRLLGWLLHHNLLAEPSVTQLTMTSVEKLMTKTWDGALVPLLSCMQGKHQVSRVALIKYHPTLCERARMHFYYLFQRCMLKIIYFHRNYICYTLHQEVLPEK